MMNYHRKYYPISLLIIVVLLLVVSFPAAGAENYQIDPVHTSVTFKIKHLAVSYVHGRFNDVSGNLTYDQASPANSSIEIQVKTESIDTTNAKRDEDLRSSNFFDAQKFPMIRFKSTSVKKVDEDNYEVTGDLTLHGVTRQLTATALKTGEGKDPWGGYRIGFETAFVIKRSDFGMKHMLGGVGDKVRMIVSVEAIRK
jgi:polyisoprenoid-binding protein YceI